MGLKTYDEGKEPSFPSNYDVIRRTTLNFTDIVGNSNKFYNLEVQVAKNGDARIFTTYGRVGGTAAREYRIADDQAHAEKEAGKIIKSKTKKGYVEVKLVKADVGSEVGKAKVDNTAVSVEALKKAGVEVKEEGDTSKLHPEVKDLVRTWFGITQEFIELNLDTNKCPLGQLSFDQITKGRDILEEARKIVHMSKPDKKEINKLTNLYYSNIPHNFGYYKLDVDALLLNADDKIDKAFDILDVFSDAKNIQTVISKKSAVDAQYETLKADLEFVDPSEATWKWLQAMVLETRASNHSGLGKLKVHKIFRLKRHGEDKRFMDNAEEIAKECGKFSPSSIYASLVKKRPDVPKELQSIYEKANVLPAWHGTRRANMIGITTKGLLIRPSGVPHAGSMYGDGIYWAVHSTKSMNYCDVKGSYWAQGNNKTAYLFLGDVAFGKQMMAGYSSMYTRNGIKPHHSVWAKSGGNSGLINDELITYTPNGPNQQHNIRYIIEFETQAK
jgi:poly [ADP-ribose] polymerase